MAAIWKNGGHFKLTSRLFLISDQSAKISAYITKLTLFHLSAPLFSGSCAMLVVIRAAILMTVGERKRKF